jgi:hypothetical protein
VAAVRLELDESLDYKTLVYKGDAGIFSRQQPHGIVELHML